MDNQYIKIRNFSIIAHIDHGKSTLADRMLEMTKTISERERKDRLLDTLDLEQERGITIKLNTARMLHNGHILNLIDTPGHVDFSYEVSRSLVASEGALLLVDATQGIQAQTLTTIYKALEHNLEIIPVINKVDLPSAETQRVVKEIEKNFGFKDEEILKVSAKTGMGVKQLLDRIVEVVPHPEIEQSKEEVTKAFIFDSFYHEHKGVIAMVKLFSGELKAREELHIINSDLDFEPIEIGYTAPALLKADSIRMGEVGYIATGLKDIRKIHPGDTITLATSPDIDPLPGYQKPKPMVFASIYPVDADDFPELQDSLAKLALTDAALTYKKEANQALGSGFNCGFLGLLHLEIAMERLEREFDLNLISTSPSVEYLVKLTTTDYSKLPGVNTANIDSQNILHVHAASDYPDLSLIDYVQEPWAGLEILTPEEYIGEIMELSTSSRGLYKNLEYISDQMIEGKKHVLLKYEIPTREIITDFFDKLKSLTQGYASMDYETFEYRESSIAKVSIMVNGEEVDALSFLTHKSKAETEGRRVVIKLKDLIPRQQFKIALQAAIGGKVIARETIQAYRKDVTAKLYGGDITRKKKLLEKQKKGKKRMKQFGSVEIPKEAFISALKS
ncbi:MAG: translation elongation factor 4 [Candidatus Dojkabacteria bacterium]